MSFKVQTKTDRDKRSDLLPAFMMGSFEALTLGLGNPNSIAPPAFYLRVEEILTLAEPLCGFILFYYVCIRQLQRGNSKH